MAGSLVLRWLLTAAFALAGGYCTIQSVASWRARRRMDMSALTANVAHVSMSAAMIAMVWWALSWQVLTWELTAFAVAGGWFAVRIVAMSQRSVEGAARTATTHGPAHSKLACAHHTAAMAAMVWMLTVMATHPGMRGMPSHAPTLPASRAFAAAVLGVYFVVAAAMWLVWFRRRQRVPGSAAHALMSAAMGTAFFTLAW
jgi:Domain of unknown function (DUF5134)